MSLQSIAVGKRHCRVLYHSGAAGIDIIDDLRQQSFKKIWTGENFAALRQTQNLPMFESYQTCDVFLENNRRLA